MATNSYNRWKKGGRPKKVRPRYTLCQILKQIGDTAGNNDKLEILKKNANREDLKHTLKMANDPFIRFHVIIPKEKLEKAKLHKSQPELWHERNIKNFFELLDLLARKKVVGKEARRQTLEFLQSCAADQAEWFRRILNKDLGIGLHHASINKVWPNLIHTHDLQLCASLSMEKTEKKVRAIIEKHGFIWAEPKLDGERVYMVFPSKRSEEPYALSRTGLPLPGLEYLLKKMQGSHRGRVIDVEACGKNWNKAITLARADRATFKKLKKEGIVLRAYCFDSIPYKHYEEKQCFTPYEKRRKALKKGLKKVRSPYIHLVDHWKVKTWKEAKKLAAECVEAGYEGIVLKVPKSPYIFRRTDLWIRLKTFKSVDVPIVSVKKGKAGTKLENTMGHIIIKYKNVEFGVGTGFTEKLRNWIWKHQKELIGKIAEVKVQEAPGFGGLLRPPLVFRRFREDKRV